MHEQVGSVLSEPKSRGLRPMCSAAVRAHPSLVVSVALVVLAAISTAVHWIFVGWVHGPLVFVDELGYERMALSLAKTGHLTLFGNTSLAYSPLYPVVLSPVYLLTHSVRSAYEWAKVENAVLLSLSVFPVYGIARSVLPRGRSLGVAALSLLAPLMLYSGFEMSESLAFPICLAAMWTILRAVRRPGVGNDALMLLAIVLASAARLQLVVLLPAAITAVLLVALVRPEPMESRGRAALQAMARHWLLFGTVAVALIAVLLRRAVNGGALPLAGRYANVGTAHASLWRVFVLFFQHLAELDLAVGVIPFAAALLGGYALVRLGFPRRALVFASVAVASSFWMLLEVAFDAAAFDAKSLHPRPGSSIDIPRIHERYLIYLVPFFLVALVAALPLFRSKIPARRHLAIAVVVAVLPVLIPFGTIVNITSPFESMALQPFGKVVNGGIVAAHHATLAAVGLAALMAFGYLRAAFRPLPSLAVTMTVIALLALSGVELSRQTASVAPAGLQIPPRHDWVDRVIGQRAQVSLVGGAGVQSIALEETAYWNESIARVYKTCFTAFGTGYGEEQLTLQRANHELATSAGAIHTPYAVVPAAFHVAGRILARDTLGKLVLVAPSGGVLRIPARGRAALACPS